MKTKETFSNDFWCPHCKKKVNVVWEYPDFESSDLVCERCGSNEIGAWKGEEFNPSER